VSFNFKEELRLLFNGLVRQHDVNLHPDYLKQSFEAGRALVAHQESAPR
jgi:hypothetical protein